MNGSWLFLQRLAKFSGKRGFIGPTYKQAAAKHWQAPYLTALVMGKLHLLNTQVIGIGKIAKKSLV
ncbi:MAG: hypothetical protein WA705_06420 [Candidatus Ozemobacteraceae bacterium]